MIQQEAEALSYTGGAGQRNAPASCLRALGMTPAGLFGLLLVETGLMGLIAGLLSVPVGLGIAATLMYVLYERCFGFSMDLHVDPVIVAQGIGLAVRAALLGSTPPAGPPGARRPRYRAERASWGSSRRLTVAPRAA